MFPIADVGPTRDNFPFTTQHSASGRITALALGLNGRMYAGSFAGLWRSDDAGQTWYQLTWPQPQSGAFQADIPGALYPQVIYDVAVSRADPDIVLVSGLSSLFSDDRDGIYQSTDGGASWTLVLPSSVPCNIVFAPDDLSLVYAAVGNAVAMSTDAGATWSLTPLCPVWHIAVGPFDLTSGARCVYAAGESQIWFSPDAGATWIADNGVSTINNVRSALNDFQVSCSPTAGLGGFAYPIDVNFGGGAGASLLAIEPGNPAHVFLATEGGANGPRFYKPGVADGSPVNVQCDNLAGEGSLWFGDFSQFSSANPSAVWNQLPGPPLYFGTTTPSGVVYVKAQATSSGFLLFFADSTHVHVSAGLPSASSWHRIDGQDASVAHRAGIHFNVVFMHVDPHSLVFTPNFEITLQPASGVPAPFNGNSELDQYIAGTLWMANDGGVVWAQDGGKNAQSWNWPLGLGTLNPVNIAGLFGFGSQPALYFGSGDNDDFFSLDGGQSWGDPGSNCGDCDAWFSDVAQPSRAIYFLPRQTPGVVALVSTTNPNQYPNAATGTKIFIPSTRTSNNAPYASSGAVLNGLRPVIKTLATESPLPDGDYVLIDQDQTTGALSLKRTTSISSISTVADWDDPSKATVIGPNLPAGTSVVQPSGGHLNPVFYVAGAGQIFKLNAVNNNWDQIVPFTPLAGTGVKPALSWFVDPYDPNGVYVLDPDGMKVSPDGGETWFFDPAMTAAITAGGNLSIQAALLTDMQFSRGERQTRFSVGAAGVACTMDFGITWFPLLNSIALPGRPESGFFDPISDLYDRAFYAQCYGRSVLRIGGLPDLPPLQPPPVLDLMEFAALDY